MWKCSRQNKLSQLTILIFFYKKLNFKKLAAFQYGQKNSDRGNITKGKNRKDRRAEVHGNKEKQKLDHQMQKIKQIMDKREKTKKGGGDTYKAKY